MSKTCTISASKEPDVNLGHNYREFGSRNWPSHIDQARTEMNVEYTHLNLGEVYDELFSESVKKHDAEQTRKDRKLGSASAYLDKVTRSKQQSPVYEHILQFGDMFSHGWTGQKTPEWEEASEMLDEVPLFEGYKDYKTVTRNNKIRYVDPEMNQFLEDIKNSHGDQFKEVVGYTDFDLLGAGNGKEVMRLQENMLCDLVADSMRYYGNSDIALLNAGTIRNDFLKGEITYEKILNVLPFSNRIMVFEIEGKEILDALEYGMRTLPDLSSRFSQVSGIKFKVDDSIPSPVVVNEIESFDKVVGERRVYDVYIGNEKLDENKLYKVSVNDYMAEGGDGYSMFSKHNVTNDTTIMLDGACKDYIKIVLNGSIPDEYRTVQGRIVKQKKKNSSNSSKFIKYFRGFVIFLLCLIF